jgi:hypothetical protein
MRAPIAVVAASALSLAGCVSEVPSDSSAQYGAFRVANLAPDLPAIDFCTALSGTAGFQGPFMKGMGETNGIQYAVPGSQVAKYGSVQTGQWVVRIVAANASDCQVPLVPDATLSVGSQGWYTVGVTGLAGSSSAPHSQYTYVDAYQAPSGQVMVRFANAALSGSEKAPPLDAGTGAPPAFQVAFPAVAYPGTAAPSATVNASGYATVPATSLVAGTALTACISGAAPGPLTCPFATTLGGSGLPALYTATAFAVGGTATAPARFLLCWDNVPAPSGNFAACQ